jgi:sarcosine oxidase, subunit beta
VSTHDVVVVGAGILGAAAALEIARHGLKVVVLERGALAREGSGTTAGNLHVQSVHTRRPDQQVPLDARRFLPLQKAASDMWGSVPDLLDADIELVRTGGLTVAETEDQEQELKEKAQWEAEAGVRTEVLDAAAARDALPVLGPTVRAATWCPEDGYANPLLTTPAYLTAARRHGVEVRPHSPVCAIGRRGTGWRVHAGTGSFDCASVVNTAGPWLSEVTALTGVALAMTPLAIQMHATVRVPPVLPHLVQHIGEGLSVKQVSSGTILIGGGWPSGAVAAAGRRTRISMASLLGNIAQAVRILPMLGSLRLLRAWAGPLAATPDEMPVIGAVPGVDDFFVAGGTYAFTFAPLWAKTLADLVTHQPHLPIDIAGLDPDRLITDRAHFAGGVHE